jgi:hypothetical protein
MSDPLDLIRRAVDRSAELLTILDVEHTPIGLHARARAVRHEIRTLQEQLSQLFSDITAQTPGKVGTASPETSRAAARAMATRTGSQRHTILAALGRQPSADWQIQSDTGIMANSQRPRRLELVEAGYVAAATDDDGKRVVVKDPDSGFDCQVWQITAKGRTALSVLNSGQMVIDYGTGGRG